MEHQIPYVIGNIISNKGSIARSIYPSGFTVQSPIHLNGPFSGIVPMDMNASPAPKAVVVGAGPVGCLSAIALANLGWHVTVYERRSGTLPLLVFEPQ
jgi:NADPH-dependent 2,4-dienoyl-CoA reductase/sulfur reductase-like enzyme